MMTNSKNDTPVENRPPKKTTQAVGRPTPKHDKLAQTTAGRGHGVCGGMRRAGLLADHMGHRHCGMAAQGWGRGAGPYFRPVNHVDVYIIYACTHTYNATSIVFITIIIVSINFIMCLPNPRPKILDVGGINRYVRYV